MSFADKLLCAIVVLGSGAFYLFRRLWMGKVEKAERKVAVVTAKEQVNAIEEKAEDQSKRTPTSDILLDIERRYGPGSDGKSDDRG